MKTKSGHITNGSFIKYKSGFTGSWCVETKDKTEYFSKEEEADIYIHKECQLDNTELHAYNVIMYINEFLDKENPIFHNSSFRFLDNKLQELKAF